MYTVFLIFLKTFLDTYLPEELTDSLGEKSCKKCPKETVR